MHIHVPAGALAGLRAMALRAPSPLLPPPPPLGQRWHCGPRIAAAAAAVAGDAPTPFEATPPTGTNLPESGVKGGDKLLASVRHLLAEQRPEAAAFLLMEEWAASGRQLEDAALSKTLLLQLVELSSLAAVEVLPVVASSADTCTAAIHALAGKRNLRAVQAVLQHAQQGKLSLGPEARQLWQAAIVAFGQLGRPRLARLAFKGMRAAGAWDVSDTLTVNQLLNALASDIDVQFMRCDQLRREGVQPDAATFNTLLKACMRARSVQQAARVLAWAQEDSVRLDEIGWNTLIKVHSYSQDFDGVLRVWQQMHDARFTPTPKLWGSLLMACSAAAQMEQAGIFWWEMRQLHSQGGGGVLTADNVAAMMTACNDAAQYERALAAFEEAQALGVRMDTRAYNIALRACHTPGRTLRQEQLLQAFSLYDELKRRRLPPDPFTFATLFSLCAAARQGHCALQLYDEMRELGVQENVVSMTALLKAVGSTPGMAADCSRIFRRMQRGPARVKPNRTTYRTAIAALREQGELAAALRVYEAMRRLHPADNREFEGLTAVAAERALSAEDDELRSAVAAVCGIASCAEVDLHGRSVLEARAAVLCMLAMLQRQYRDAGTIAHDVTIITGRGLGSEGGEPRVRHEVVRLLEALFAGLPPQALEGNPGRVVLPRRLVCEAMARKMVQRARQGVPPPQSPLRLPPDGWASEAPGGDASAT